MSPDLSIHTTTTLLTPNTPSTDTRDTDTDTDTKKDTKELTITLENSQKLMTLTTRVRDVDDRDTENS